jgi:hypothetical protein
MDVGHDSCYTHTRTIYYLTNILPDKTASEKRAIIKADTSPFLVKIANTMPYVYFIVKTQKAGDVIFSV